MTFDNGLERAAQIADYMASGNTGDEQLMAERIGYAIRALKGRNASPGNGMEILELTEAEARLSYPHAKKRSSGPDKP